MRGEGERPRSRSEALDRGSARISRGGFLKASGALLGAASLGMRPGSAFAAGERLRGGGRSLEARSYDAELRSFDGTKIAFTVFQPRLERGEAAPLVLHSHGYGGSRIEEMEHGPPRPADPADVPAEALRRAWSSGYFAISFDERGFGDSGDRVNVMDPEYEGRDISAVLDWAEENLSPHLGYSDGRPVVGALGLSYGGGFQLVGSSVDPRFGALVPTATWNDLPYSLASGEVPKTQWGQLLTGIGAAGSMGRLEPFLYELFVQAIVKNRLPERLEERLHDNGLQAFCETGDAPQVPTFLVQGASDTLFNINEALYNAECLRDAGSDVRLLIQRTGHALPALQDGNGEIGFRVDPRVSDGSRSYETARMMLDFLNEKLLGKKPSKEIPEVCISLGEEIGLAPEQAPRGGRGFEVPGATVTTGPNLDLIAKYLQELPTRTLADALAGAPGDARELLLAVAAGLAEPERLEDVPPATLALIPPREANELTTADEFVPLLVVQEETFLTGVPLAELEVDATGPDPIVFVGLGVQPGGDRRTRLIDDQILPLRGEQSYSGELVGVSRLLQPGETLGLAVYGFHPQYMANFSRVPSRCSIAGEVRLPLVKRTG